ncbi:MAG: NUDIX hydrolase [Gammaproteobacteria bacterium]|nr:NUDIX hydrolase [Gammaproteobacteria bacterium]
MPAAPIISVATIIERDGTFLFVEETVKSRLVINQPAGRLEAGESLLQAAVRETLEETGWTIEPQGLVGVYRFNSERENKAYLRVCFHGCALQHDALRPLDEGIVRALWLSPAALLQRRHELRTPLVLRCVDDYLAGRRFPLELLVDLA